MQHDLALVSPSITVDVEVPFDGWKIDLVGARGAERVAVEGKFKVQGDGAVPDNRKAAFFDLFKLESYVASGRYSHGLFVWLTDEAAYVRPATRDSAAFSTHHGRVYQSGTALHAKRSRSTMPLPLVLTLQYHFSWQPIPPGARWHVLVLRLS